MKNFELEVKISFPQTRGMTLIKLLNLLKLSLFSFLYKLGLPAYVSGLLPKLNEPIRNL